VQIRGIGVICGEVYNAFPCHRSSVRGSIDSSQLGVTLMHEHVFVLDTEILQNYPEEWGDEEKRVADAVTRMNELKSRGVDSIVDLTVIGLGRYIPRILEIARQTRINIIVATGIYTYQNAPLYFHFRGPGTVLDGPELMVDMFVRDIQEGIADTRVKAGILKCATDEPGVTKDVERILRATAQAHLKTGLVPSKFVNTTSPFNSDAIVGTVAGA
jgi:phosphotriesterase-related protein